MNTINSFVNYICNLLKIKPPIIIHKPESFPTKTTLAQISIDGKYLNVRTSYANKSDLYFALSHELRHCWQIQSDFSLYFSNWEPSSKIGVEKYNLQIAEVDANAFAAIILENIFCITPLWDGIPNSVKTAISLRKDYIEKQLFL